MKKIFSLLLIAFIPCLYFNVSAQNAEGSPISVKSEIKPLKKVLLHRPGRELANLTPKTLEKLLFDDIPFLKVAQKEHDIFSQKLRENGVETVYLEDLAAKAIDSDEKVRDQFIHQFLKEADTKSKYKKQAYHFLNDIQDSKQLILKTMEGIRVSDIYDAQTLKKKGISNGEFVTEPLPNLYFTRDDFASIGSGISLNKMRFETRRRETIYADYIFKYLPEYKGAKKYYDRDLKNNIEGGDILNLNAKTLAVGISQRTSLDAVKKLAENIFKDKTSEIETIIALKIPNSRAMMHLDTVFTQVDYDKFTICAEIEKELDIFVITKGSQSKGISIKKNSAKLENILSKYLGLEKVTLISCGGKDVIASESEQWNDGSNTLAIKPGVVVVYDRNEITNKILREQGIEVLEIPSAEISRGRGGPRCMSMPLVRED